MSNQEHMENLALQRLITIRNKLIGDLLVELPRSGGIFKKGLDMRDKMWEQDKKIWAEARKEVMKDGQPI